MDDALRAVIMRAAIRYNALDAEEIAQIILMDIFDGREWLADPANRPQLLRRTRQRVLTQMRGDRRRRFHEGQYAIETYGSMFDECSEAAEYGDEWVH